MNETADTSSPTTAPTESPSVESNEGIPALMQGDTGDSFTPDESNARLMKRFEAAKHAELKVRKAEQLLRQREQQTSARQKEWESKISETENIKQMFHHDPLAALQAIGVEDMKGFLERIITPASAESKRIEALEARLASQEKERVSREQARELAQRKEQTHKLMQSFVEQTDEKQYPYTMGVFSKQEIPQMVHHVLATHGPEFFKRNKRHPTDNELREVIEYTAKQRYKTAASRLKELEASIEPSVAKAGFPALVRKSGRGPHGVNGPRTLTNQHAAQSATAKVSQSFDRATARKELLERLRAEASTPSK